MLLANIVLLVHAIVPHHRHEKTGVCFDISHHNSCNETHHCNSEPHEHENNPISNKCFIDNVFPPEQNNIKIACHVHKKCDCVKLLLYTLIPNNLNIRDIVNDNTVFFRQNPCVLIFHTEFISHSTGFRAPPAC